MARIALVFLLLTAPMFARNDFDDLVQTLESQYGKKKVYIPMLGFANFIVKFAKPVGTSDFKLAMFEDVDGGRHPDAEELDRRFRPNGWKPFVKVLSKAGRERVHIYARESKGDHELLIATFERHEAVLIRVRVNAERLARWVNNPVVMAKSRGRSEAD
jgi:hypothetical protein